MRHQKTVAKRGVLLYNTSVGLYDKRRYMAVRPKVMGSIILSAVVILVLFCSCSGLPLATSQQIETQQPRYQENETPDEITLAYDPSQGSNPYLTNSLVVHQLAGLLYTSLVEIDEDLNTRNLLADMISSNEENTVFTVLIKNGRTFEDGAEVTAQDVAASLIAAQNSDAYVATMQNVDSIILLDNEIQIELLTPDAFFFSLLTMPILKSDEVGAKNPMSSGEYRREADRLILRDTSSGLEPVTISLADMAGASAVTQGLNAGRISVLDTTHISGFVPYENLSVASYPTTNLLFIGFNDQSEIFGSSKQRQAVSHMMPRTDIAKKVFFENADVTHCLVHPLYGLCDCTIADTTAEFDSVTILYNGAIATRHSVIAQLESAFAGFGIAVNELVADDSEHFNELLSQGEYDLYLAEVLLPDNLDFSFFIDEDSSTQRLVAGYSDMKSSRDTDMFCNAFSAEMPIVPILFERGTVYYDDQLYGFLPKNSDPYFGLSEVEFLK